MWVSTNSKWHKTHTDLSKYFIEKLIQLVDFDESLSNRHKTTNGYILINEISYLSSITLKKEKSIYRLKSLIEESSDKKLVCSIGNDYIINKYHKNLVEYYQKLFASLIKGRPQNVKIPHAEISKLKVDSNIHCEILDKSYFEKIKRELNELNWGNEHFDTHVRLIEKLLNCLVPFLFSKGYSAERMGKVAINSATISLDDFLEFIFEKFPMNEQEYMFFIRFNIKSKREKFLEFFKNYLDERGIKWKVKTAAEASKEVKFETGFKDSTDNPYLLFNCKCFDPNTFIRNLYDDSLKRFVIYKERDDLRFFSYFFDLVYWKNKSSKSGYKRSEFNLDPINVKSRSNTLDSTLNLCTSYYSFIRKFERGKLPVIPCIEEAVYFYHLALGSKSIENSMNLLWTTLETLNPYMLHKNDIANVQHFISKYISVGSMGRQLYHFAKRYYAYSKFNDDCFKRFEPVSPESFNSEAGILKWHYWICRKYDVPEEDPYKYLSMHSPLISERFVSTNNNWSNGDHNSWTQRINVSRSLIHYQLDRIYLQRNQIVHTAKFYTEYSNLWSHLEWYVGKILSYFYIQYFTSPEVIADKKSVLQKLEAECDLIINTIHINEDKPLTEIHENDLKHIYSNFWQIC